MHARRVAALSIAATLFAAGAAAQTALPELPELRGARAILINDRAGGQLVSYNVERQDEAGFYAGSVSFVVAPGTPAERTTSGLVALPAEAAARFFAALAAVPVSAAPAPSATRSVGPPLYILHLKAGDFEVQFESALPADARGAWRVTVSGPAGARELSADADAVRRALRILDPHLKRDWVDARRREAGAPGAR